MRMWIACLVVGCALTTAPADASEESRQKALNAAGIFAALAYECDRYVEGDLKTQAREDAVPTLQAGGFSALEAEAKTSEIFAALDGSWKETGIPEAMCNRMAKGIVDGRAQLRLDLQAAQ